MFALPRLNCWRQHHHLISYFYLSVDSMRWLVVIIVSRRWRLACGSCFPFLCVVCFFRCLWILPSFFGMNPQVSVCCLLMTYPTLLTIAHDVHLLPWPLNSSLWRVISLTTEIAHLRCPLFLFGEGDFSLSSALTFVEVFAFVLFGDFFSAIFKDASLALARFWVVVFISVVRDAVLRRVVLDGLTAALGGFFLDGVVICWSPSVPPLETGDVFFLFFSVILLSAAVAPR